MGRRPSGRRASVHPIFLALWDASGSLRPDGRKDGPAPRQGTGRPSHGPGWASRIRGGGKAERSVGLPLATQGILEEAFAPLRGRCPKGEVKHKEAFRWGGVGGVTLAAAFPEGEPAQALGQPKGSFDRYP